MADTLVARCVFEAVEAHLSGEGKFSSPLSVRFHLTEAIGSIADEIDGATGDRRRGLQLLSSFALEYRAMMDRRIDMDKHPIMSDPRFTRAVYAIQATPQEVHLLYRAQTPPILWKVENDSYDVEVGRFADQPVTIKVQFAHVLNHWIVFYHSASDVVVHTMVRDWLDEHLPVARDHHADAANLAHAILHVERLNREAR